MEINSDIELYDSDIANIDKVVEVLARKQGHETNLEGFRQECIDTFGKIGLKVDVLVYTTDQAGLFWFEVQIQGRTEEHEFDHDRQRHEAVSNYLGIPGEGGVIKTDGIVDLSKHAHMN